MNFQDLKKRFFDREFSFLNERQKDAVFSIYGNLLVLAGAGSGKTTVVINRIYNIIQFGDLYNSEIDVSSDDLKVLENGLNNGKSLSDYLDLFNIKPVDPENILAITFTNKASNEIKDRLKYKLGDRSGNIWASTFHSMCVKILRRHADRLGCSSDFTIYDSDDSKKLIKDCLKNLNIEEKNISVKLCINEISSSKDSMVNFSDYKIKVQDDFRLSKVAQVYELYTDRLKKSEAMDFDDLIFNTVNLLKNNSDILELYREKFKFIMVDEYQDTSKSQHELIKLLAGTSGNLCVVGDDDQSIYKFRGANVENILKFDETFKNAKVIRLEQNYRSTKNILSAANSIIKNNLERKAKTLWTASESGEKIHVHVGCSEHDEANVITSEIIKSTKGGKRKYSDYAVLYRNGSQSAVIEKLMTKNKIPYRVVGSIRFFERKEIKDLISYLSVINNPYDEVRLRRIINRPSRSIGERTLGSIMETAEKYGKSFFEVLKNASSYSSLQRAFVKVSSFVSLIESLIAESKKGIKIVDLFDIILEKTGYINFIKENEENPDSKIENIKELRGYISVFEEEQGSKASLRSFLEDISLVSDPVDSENSDDFVTLMTIHASKGLEFPVVFLPGFEEGVFPGAQCIYDSGEIEEERRLAYVALTRAKEKIFILHSTSRMIFGSTSHNKPSRFLEEIPQELIEVTRSREWKRISDGQKLPKSNHDTRVKSVVFARNFGQNPLSVKGVFPSNKLFSGKFPCVKDISGKV